MALKDLAGAQHRTDIFQNNPLPGPALSFHTHLRTFLSLISLRVLLYRKRPLLLSHIRSHITVASGLFHLHYTYPSAFSPATVYTLSRYVFQLLCDLLNNPPTRLISLFNMTCLLHSTLGHSRCSSDIPVIPRPLFCTLQRAIGTDARPLS